MAGAAGHRKRAPRRRRLSPGSGRVPPAAAAVAASTGAFFLFFFVLVVCFLARPVLPMSRAESAELREEARCWAREETYLAFHFSFISKLINKIKRF